MGTQPSQKNFELNQESPSYLSVNDGAAQPHDLLVNESYSAWCWAFCLSFFSVMRL